MLGIIKLVLASACYTSLMPDTPRPDATSRDSQYSLSVEDAATLYARAGHPRTLRTVQRYCASGHLDCVKAQTMLGDKYFVEPSSVSRHIAQIEELMPLENRAPSPGAPRPAATTEVYITTDDGARQTTTTSHDMPPLVAPAISPGQNAPNSNSHDKIESDNPRQAAAQSPDVSRPVAATGNDVPLLVMHLEKEIERLSEDRTFLRQQIVTKDDQIAALLERDRETNILVRGLQQMLSPLLGPPRSDQSHDREPPAGF